MADILHQKDGAKATAPGSSVKVDALTYRQGPTAGGGDIYVRSAILANGDVEYRWNRFEPPAK